MKRFRQWISSRSRSSSPSPRTTKPPPIDPYTHDPRKPKPTTTSSANSVPKSKTTTIHASHILLPLYIYPTLTPSSWEPLYAALAAHPDTTFRIIVNPGSGPGSTEYPDTNYISSIAQLHKYANAHLLGYVSTQYAKRSQALVEADIAAYAAWAEYPDADIHVSGIFFDEAPSGWTGETEAYMRSISEYVKKTFPDAKGTNHVTFNPGVICDSRFFPLADEVVVSENGYAMFGMDILRFVEAGLRAKASVVVHGFNGTADEMGDMVAGLAEEGFGGVYITTEGGYTGWGNLWEILAKSAGAGGSGGK